MFKDRQEAGELLAQKLVSVIKDEDVIVLGIPRGGVVVAKEVARRFDAPFDVVVIKKIGAPNRKGKRTESAGEAFTGDKAHVITKK